MIDPSGSIIFGISLVLGLIIYHYFIHPYLFTHDNLNFSNFIQIADQAEELIHDSIERNSTNFAIKEWIAISLMIAISIIASILSLRFSRNIVAQINHFLGGTEDEFTNIVIVLD